MLRVLVVFGLNATLICSLIIIITRRPNLRSKGQSQGHWQRKCKNRFCAYLRQKWIDLRQTKTKMIIGPLSSNIFHQRKCFVFVTFVSKLSMEGRMSQQPAVRFQWLQLHASEWWNVIKHLTNWNLFVHHWRKRHWLVSLKVNDLCWLLVVGIYSSSDAEATSSDARHTIRLVAATDDAVARYMRWSTTWDEAVLTATSQSRCEFTWGREARPQERAV